MRPKPLMPTLMVTEGKVVSEARGGGRVEGWWAAEAAAAAAGGLGALVVLAIVSYQSITKKKVAARCVACVFCFLLFREVCLVQPSRDTVVVMMIDGGRRRRCVASESQVANISEQCSEGNRCSVGVVPQGALCLLSTRKGATDTRQKGRCRCFLCTKVRYEI